MFQALFGQKTTHRHAHALYGAVVARARNADFYAKYGVPDTFDGRFEMLVVHIYLLASRLKGEDKQARAVSQAVFDLFLADMDSALREAAVGDVTVPKRIAKMTRVFYGRVGAFDEAFASDDPKKNLAGVIERNLFADQNSDGREHHLASYMVSEAEKLAAMTATQVIAADRVYADDLHNTDFGKQQP